MTMRAEDYSLVCSLYDQLEEVLAKERQAILEDHTENLMDHASTRNSLLAEIEKLGLLSKGPDANLEKRLVNRLQSVATICEENRQYLSQKYSAMENTLSRLPLSRKAQKAYITCGCR